MPVHHEQRVLPYTPQQLYDLVADIESYPRFLPWVIATRIRERRHNLVEADTIVGFRMIRERFVSRASFDPDHKRIDIHYLEGPFQHMESHWIFHPAPGGQTRLEFYVDFEFRSRLLRNLMAMLFDEAVKRMVQAFEKRAKELYGANPAIAVSA